jgi:hypothetical protein
VTTRDALLPARTATWSIAFVTSVNVVGQPPPPPNQRVRRYSMFHAAHPRSTVARANSFISVLVYIDRRNPPWIKTTTGAPPALTWSGEPQVADLTPLMAVTVADATHSGHGSAHG